jgi:N-acetylglucosaminyldiphosphoundecaprenol N-acetyl-beta-D-mannosaminyltransferase
VTAVLDHRPTSVDAQDRRMLFGLGLDPVTLDQAVDRCRVALDADGRVLVGVLNAAKVVNLRGDALLRDSLLDCDMLLADGQSVVWASRMLRQPLPERVAGIDLFESLLELAHREGRSVFLLGAKSEVLTRLLDVIEERWPGLRIAGARDGYFTAEQGAEVAAEIRSARPDMLFLGITSPKKEIFLATHGDALGVAVLHGVGGSFDVMAGVTRRAPEAWQRAGMEWAYRLVQEPRRMWKRYLRTNTIFIGLVARERVRPTKPFVPSAPRSHS